MKRNQNRCRCCGKKTSNCDWKEKFSKAGLKFTTPRQNILKALGDSEAPLSAEDIHKICEEIMPGIGIATIYRTVELLTGMGFLNKIEFPDKISRYSLLSHKHAHYMICTNCSKVIDYTNDIPSKERESMHKIEEILSQKYNFDIRNHTVKFTGLCEECKKTE